MYKMYESRCPLITICEKLDSVRVKLLSKPNIFSICLEV
jgi:hypothetical protein